MNDISIYFESISTSGVTFDEGSIGEQLLMNDTSFPELKKGDIAFFYVPEYRGASSDGEKIELNRDLFRYYFSKLTPGSNWQSRLVDLGNIRAGKTLEDTYFAVSNVVFELIKNDIIPVIIGGTQDLTYAQFKGYEKLEQAVNLVVVDNKFDVGAPDKPIHKDGFLSHIILHEPNFLFNYSNIGYQTYFVKPSELELFDQMYFDTCRLGLFNQDFKLAEPLIRNCDLLSFDLLSIRASDFPSSFNKSPNGFYGEQACQIARYAGLSDKLTSFGLYNLIPENQPNGVSDHLASQIIWHLIEGINSRKKDFPVGSKAGYTKYHVDLQDFKDEVVFYKSDRSDRWWMEVPYPPKSGSRFERHFMVPCNYEDYITASKNEIPDLWWKTYQKLV
jgi:formiminoglutamase